MCCHIAGGGQEQEDAGVKPFCALLFTVQESRKQLPGYTSMYTAIVLFILCMSHSSLEHCFALLPIVG